MGRRAASSTRARVAGGRRPPLGQQAVSADTRSRYKRAVVDFVRWCDDNGGRADDDEEMDDLMVNYFQELCETDRGRSVAEATLYGLIMFLPRAKGKLSCSQQALRGWSRMTPSTSYPPFSWEVACAVGAKLARSPTEYRHGVATVLAFDCFLRVGELCALRREDVADEGDPRMGAGHKGMLLHIRKAKTGKNQSVRVYNPDVRKVVQLVVRATKPGHRLFPFSPATYRKMLRHACSELRLSKAYTPHSLRHGGATYWHNNLSRSMEAIMHRGCWASSISARLYVQ